MIAAAPPSIVAAAKAVYPRSPVTVETICRVDPLALVRLRVALKFQADEAPERHLPHLLLLVSRRVRVVSRPHRVRIPD